MQQHQTIVRIRAAEVSGFDVVSVPAGGFGDGSMIVGAFSRLLFVNLRQQTFSGKFFDQRDAQSAVHCGLVMRKRYFVAKFPV
jgi:hypothetical protein